MPAASRTAFQRANSRAMCSPKASGVEPRTTSCGADVTHTRGAFGCPPCARAGRSISSRSSDTASSAASTVGTATVVSAGVWDLAVTDQGGVVRHFTLNWTGGDLTIAGGPQTTTIKNYVNGNPNAGQEMKAKYPLAEARIQVMEIPGKPG